jgi:pimeloyl-ACP methyl ester carboxylesterase
MPTIRLDEVEIHYEVHGTGHPLLLISGLGGGSWSWYGQIPFFREHYRVVAFDNRGAGRSSMPPGPYRMIDLARDAESLLNRLEIGQTLVLGLSMGGMIAQELAISGGRRIQALVLGCTHCGGKHRIGPQPEILQAFMNNAGLTQRQILEKNLPFLFSEAFRQQEPLRIADYLRHQLAAPPQPDTAFRAQLAAIGSFDASDRIAGLQTPALVLTGSADLLVPPGNARILSTLLGNSELVELDGAGHALHVECRDRLNERIHRFFQNILTGNAHS